MKMKFKKLRKKVREIVVEMESKQRKSDIL